MEPGIYNDLDSELYHSSAGISSTGVKLIMDCPKRYFWEYFIERPSRTDLVITKSRDKFVMGRAVHMVALEQHKFDKHFYVMSGAKLNLSRNADKEIYAAAVEKAAGRQIIRAEDWEDITEMASSIMEHPRFEEMKGGMIEQSIYWNKKNGLYSPLVKARPDIYTDHIILDIKTTDSIPKFEHNIFNYGYHRQAAMQFDALYQYDGIKRHFGFLVVEKKSPYLTAAFTLDLESMELGRREYSEAADTYAECIKYNDWPAYPGEYQGIKCPKWKMREEDYDD